MAETPVVERQAKLRNRVRAGELHRVQMYLTPTVYQALKALAGGELGRTHTEVVATLILKAHSNVVERPVTPVKRKKSVKKKPAKKKKQLTMPMLIMKKAGNGYNIVFQENPIGVVNKNSDNTWTASADGNKPYFSGATRRGAVAKWLGHYNENR